MIHMCVGGGGGGGGGGVIIGHYDGLLPLQQHQTIIRTNANLFSFGPSGTNPNKILIEI